MGSVFFFLLKNSPCSRADGVRSTYRVGPVVKPRATERPVFDDCHFETLLRSHKRRFAASRPSSDDGKLIIPIHNVIKPSPSFPSS